MKRCPLSKHHSAVSKGRAVVRAGARRENYTGVFAKESY
jgi:hypothetical protein